MKCNKVREVRRKPSSQGEKKLWHKGWELEQLVETIIGMGVKHLVINGQIGNTPKTLSSNKHLTLT
jgi:hypothetical protein